MTSRAQEIPDKSGSGRSRKMLWRSGISLAAAAFLLASAAQPAQAQAPLRAPHMMVENAPHGNNVNIQRPEIAQNQRHDRAPDFHARDIRISAPLNPLPVNDIKISAPINPLPVQNIRIAGSADPGVENIRIGAPIALSGTDQSQARSGMVAINQAQLVGPRISTVQALQAELILVSEATLLSRSTNSDLVTVSGPQTFINWAPLDTANSDSLINILPAGTSLTFVGPDSGYTVLNRILPTGTTASGIPRAIAFGGNVTSRLGASDGSIGGNIWFYSPGGIVIGAGSTFDVGGLVLTTNDIDTTGGLFGPGGEIRFSGASDSISSVIIENGATINALNDRSSYVAMVAPRIVQGGTINVDGSAAYVAAEQAELTINNGLFDITIGVGTTDANGLVHSGTTTGPSSTPSLDGLDTDAQAIFMVAVPKNDALTMLVGGSLGYQPAASASIINGNVVLSAGADVATTGDLTNARFAIDKAAADSDSNIQLQNVAFGSSVSTFATNGIVAATASVTDFVIANNSVGTQDLLIEARNQIDINARGGGVIGANGNVTLRSGTDGVGGTININADQIGFGDLITSGLLATGNLVVDASAAGLDDFSTVRNNGGTGVGQDAVGGNININISGGGDLVVGGAAQFLARAQGGKGENQNGSGQGGTINLNMSSGTFNIAGTALFDAQVIEAQNLKIGGNGPGLVGSGSIGGAVSLTLSGGVVTTGNMFVDLGAIATSGEPTGGVQSNDATSGIFDLSVTGGSHVINYLSVSALADATAGSFDATGSEISGFARSGGANFLIDGGSLTVSSNLESNVSTYGISPANPADRVALTVRNGGTLTVAGSVFIDTGAFDGIDTATSIGGSISILTDNAVITTGNLFLNSSARPNNSFFFMTADEGRDFQAGDISLVAQNGGAFTSTFTSFSANATGNNANAGSGTGGEILIHANNGSINFTDRAFIDASGIGGVGGSKDNPASLGTGRGGSINLRVEGTGGALSFTGLSINADGSISSNGESGAPSFEGDGGFGFGGTVTFDLFGGTLTADEIGVDTDGSGGGGGDLVTLPLSPLGISAVSQVEPADLTVVNIPFAGGTAAGDGGAGQGGNVIFNLNGGNATVTNLDISANGFGGDGADGRFNDGTAGGAGGTGTGGSAIFNAQSGSLTVTSTLTVSAQGNNQSLGYYGSRGAGGYGYGSDGGAGGDGVGGTATFNLDGSATLGAGQVIVNTNAAGGSGGSTTSAYGNLGNPIQAGIGGNGGNAMGGVARFNNNAGTMNFSQLSVTSTGAGGIGGNVSGFSGGAINRAGDGGAGTGGNAAININQDDLTNPVYLVDAGGVGGDGGGGLDGGNGGAAFGGTAAININGATAVLNNPSILARATGGAGGQGRLDNATFAAGNGGNGGNATGGTARLQVAGLGGNIDLEVITLQANGGGGQGGNGSYNFSGVGGDGGSGGNATGGRSELVARTGGTINLTSSLFDFTSTGTGGAGGIGGNTYADAAGDGGDGGSGTGGTSLFLAQGGTITGQDVNFTVAGNGGSGGAGGTYGLSGSNGLGGTGGTGSGGTAAIEVQDGSPGIIGLASVAMFANGYNAGDAVGLPTGLAGRIEISDTSIDPAGLISLASLNVQALNVAGGPTSGFFVTGNSGAMTIAGDLTVNVAGNIEYGLTGNGQMTVGGNASLTSGQDILIAHTNNIIPVNSLGVTGSFTAAAQRDFIASADSILSAGSTMVIRAERDAFINDARAVTNLLLSTGQNATLNDATVTGAPLTSPITFGTQINSGVTILAGYSPTPTPAPYDPNYDATVTGTVTSTGFVNISAGGNAIFQSGANVLSDNGVRVRSGDDIIIENGASVAAAVNPVDAPDPLSPFFTGNNLLLEAGSLQFSLSSARLTPLSSIVAPGNIDANGFAVLLSANAIDGLGGTITASSLSADINDAPSNAVVAATGQSNDNGLLSGQCVEGNICLGTINADNLVSIGQASNNDVIQGIIESGTVSARDILVTTRRDIIMGTDGIATILDASRQFLARSTEGNIDLRDASVSSGSILVSAVNGSLLGSASLTSTNDIGITVGRDINASAITTGGQLTRVADVGGGSESLYTVPGSIVVGTYAQGAAQQFRVEAGNNIRFDQITVPNRAIQLIAAQTGPGDVFLGTTTGASEIVLQGENVGYINLNATVSAISGITMVATNGSISGGDALASFTTDLEANGGNINIGNLTGGASGGTNLDATGAITVGALSGGAVINVTAGGDFNFDTAEAFRTDINATNIVGNIVRTLGTTGGTPNTLAMTASGNITIGSAIATDALDINAGGILTADILGAGLTTAITAGAIDANALNSIDIGNVTASVGDLAIGTVAGSTSVRLESLNGNILLGDVTTVGNTIAFANNGSIGFANIAAQGIGLTAGGNITGTSLTATNAGANQNINLVSGGTATIMSLFANQIVDVAAVSTNFGTITGTTQVRVLADDITTGNVTSAGQAILTSANGGINSGTINGSAVSLRAVSGGISVLDITGTSMSVMADGNITAGNLVAVTGGASDIVVNAGGNINFLSMSADRLIDVDAVGTVSGGILDATSSIDILGGNITVGDANGLALVALESRAGDVNAGALTSNGLLTVTSTGAANLSSANTGSSIAINSGDSATLGDATAGGAITLNIAGNLTTGALRSGSTSIGVNIAATGNADIGSAVSGSLLNIDAASLTAGNLTGDGLVTIDAASLNLGNVTSTNQSVTVNATNGNIVALSLNANIGIAATTSSGLINVGTASSGTGTILTGQAVTLNSGTAGGLLRLNATAGNISGSGIIAAGGAIDLDATGGIAFGSLSAAQAFTADAGGNISFTSAAGDSVILRATGNITGGDIDASTDSLSGNVAVLNAGGSISAGIVNAVDGIDIDGGGDVIVSALLGGSTDILTTGTVDIGNANSLRLTAQGSSISLGSANILNDAAAASGALVLTATTGAIAISNATTARATTLAATTDISIGTLTSGGAFGATSGRNIALGTTVADSVILFAGGDITGLSLAAPANTLVGNVVRLTAAGAINVNSINATDNVDLDAGGAIAAASIQGAFVTAAADGPVTIASATGTRLSVTGTGIDMVTANVTSNALAASGTINLDAGGGSAIIGTANSARGTRVYPV